MQLYEFGEEQKAKLWIYRLISVTTVTFAHKLWALTKRKTMQMEVVEISFFQSVSGLT